MKTFLLSLICLINLSVSAQELKDKTIPGATPLKKTKELLIHQSIQLETDRIFKKLVDIRRDFHENPELAGNEVRTQKIIKQYLLDLGLEVETDIYGHGIVGILKGDKKGKKIAWRCDMDALPNDYPDPVSFKSKIKGVQHGCGHDVHMAVGLGIAEVLAKNKKSLKGTVYFIFQPEEETFIGARSMVDNGLFSKINPDEIYGLHITALPTGQIMVKPNEVFAYQKRIRIVLKNDLPKEKAQELTKRVSNALSRNTNRKPWEIQNMTDPKIGLMDPNTIFRDYLFVDEHCTTRFKNNQFFLEAYVYETDPFLVKDIIPKVKKVVEETGYKDELVSVSFMQENPTVVNNEQLTDIATNTLRTIYGKDAVTRDYGQIPFFNDDFTYFQQKIPGVYFFLGGSNFEKGMIAMNHAPNFQVDEESIRTGVKCFSSLIVERINKN
ncbi:amidohydrolase [Chryseobacterium sp. T16E-39]|uniref:M20 metallopeptidase family protein n=1 Tax=Chryseobacterium sp. T16E-39 TaxID=2015076 RepID=UPI000B5B1282|nr:amidohydrolase [Chryseobacterium sp. T16E-39]ASK29648.1 amidohydrolase [Chryseobacterium sp. T16E-39]